MGSFSEIVLACTFRADPPPPILAAFVNQDQRQDPRHVLADLDTLTHASVIELFEYMDEEVIEQLDDNAYAWLLHWHLFQPGTAYFPGSPSTMLSMRDEQWTATTRFYVKARTRYAVALLTRLGRYLAEPEHPEWPHWIGYIKYQGDQTPVLIYHRAGAHLAFDTVATTEPYNPEFDD